MSIAARPSAAFTADLTGAPSALGTNVQCGIRQIPQGTMVSAFASTGIVETALGGGVSNYTAARTAPAVVSEPDVDGPRYQVVWKVSGAEQPPEDLFVTGSVPDANLVPDLTDIGALLRARTVDDNGNEVGTFTADTRPTATEAEALIDDAVRDVRRRAGPELDTTTDEALLDSARRLAAVRAAMLIELSYFPEQVNSDQSPYGRFKEIWDEDIAALLATLRTDPGDVQGFDDVTVASPTNAAYMDFLAGRDPWLPPA